MLTHIWTLDIEQRITSLQFTLPVKLGNKEGPKRDIHGPWRRGKGQELLRNLGARGGERERQLGKKEGEKWKGEEDIRQQED